MDAEKGWMMMMIIIIIMMMRSRMIMMMMRRRIKMMTAMAKLKTKYDRIASDLPTFQKYATSQIQ